jgi:hypothetical protein
MQIIIHPTANLPGAPDDVVSVAGDTITVNGVAFDLSSVPADGEGIPGGEHPFAGVIRREGGVLIVPLVVRYDTATALSDQPTDPAHWVVTLKTGALPDRVARKTARGTAE